MSFEKDYLFGANNLVVFKHKGGKYLRINPDKQDQVDHEGGTGKFAQFYAEIDNNGYFKFKSKESGKYLRIFKENSVDVAGTGGKLCEFKYHKQDKPGAAKFESVKFEGRYLAVRDNKVCTGSGGSFTYFECYKEKEEEKQANGSFNKPYLFGANNLVVFKHKGGKYLRINPDKQDEADHDGGTGKYAQFYAEIGNNGYFKFKSKESGKYLRIYEEKVDVKGGGGDATFFKYYKQDQPGAAKFESVKYQGQYLAVRDNKVCIGNGGPFTYFQCYKQ